MIELGWGDFISGETRIEGDVAIAIGVFDGLHLGHKALLSSITNTPEGLVPVVFTFTANPYAVLGTKAFAGNVSSLGQRKQKLEMSGIRFAVMIDFSVDFSKITGGKFIALLLERLAIRKVAVGYNFSFGYNRGMDAQKLAESMPGVRVDVIEPVFYGGEIVSSTRVRNEIKAGNFDAVRAMLEEDYSLDASGGIGFEQEGRILSIETSTVNQVLPEEGLYTINILSGGNIIHGSCEIRKPRLHVELKELIQCSSIDAIRFIERQNGRSKLNVTY